MKAKSLPTGDARSWVLAFDIGDEVLGTLERFAREQALAGAHFTAIGALQDVVLGYWDWDRKDYERIPVREQVEVLVLAGNVAQAPDGGVKVHAHLVVGRRDGSAMGGHLLEAHVRPTLELVLTETPAALRRRSDERTGLALLAP